MHGLVNSLTDNRNFLGKSLTVHWMLHLKWLSNISNHTDSVYQLYRAELMPISRSSLGKPLEWRQLLGELPQPSVNCSVVKWLADQLISSLPSYPPRQ